MAVTRISTLAALCVVLFGITFARVARAATVVLVRTANPTPVASEATIRLRGELTAEGFAVRIVELPAAAELRAALEEAAAAPDVEAVVAIFADAPGDTVELWVIDRVTGKTVTRRVPAEPLTARSAEVLSIRALELLRASFLEIALGASRAPPAIEAALPPPPPPEVARMTRVALEVRMPKTWAIEVGGCVLGSFEGLPPSLAPMVRAGRSWGEYFIGRMTLAGLGTHPRIESPRPGEGSATVAQEFGLVEAAVRLRPGRRLQPFASIGAGALHLTSDGQAETPYQGKSGSLWSAIADAGAGARLALPGRFELALELHAQLAARHPAIRFFGDDVAHAGRPTVIGSLTLVAWL